MLLDIALTSMIAHMCKDRHDMFVMALLEITNTCNELNLYQQELIELIWVHPHYEILVCL